MSTTQTADRRRLLEEMLQRKGLRRAATELIPQRSSAEVPLASYSQQRLWFADQIEGLRLTYHVPGALLLRGSLDVPALRRAFDELTHRHEILRTTFELRDGEVVQVVRPGEGFLLEETDCSDLPPELRAGALQERVDQDLGEPFDLRNGPLVRGQLIRLGSAEHALLVTLHHIVADAWSVEILLQELSALYLAFTQDRGRQLPQLPIQYADYAVWHRQWLTGERAERQLKYWTDHLRGVRPLELCVDRPRSRKEVARGVVRPFALTVQASSRIREIAREQATTVHTVMLAAFMLLLSRLSDQEDIVVAEPVTGRGHWQTEGLIGPFLNLVLVNVRVSASNSFPELVAQTKAALHSAIENSDLPFDRLAAELQGVEMGLALALGRISFTSKAAGASPAPTRELDIQPLPLQISLPKNDMVLSVSESTGNLSGAFECTQGAFTNEAIDGLPFWYISLIEQVSSAPNAALDEYELRLPDRPVGYRYSRDYFRARSYWRTKVFGESASLAVGAARVMSEGTRSASRVLPAAECSSLSRMAARIGVPVGYLTVAVTLLHLQRVTGEWNVTVGIRLAEHTAGSPTGSVDLRASPFCWRTQPETPIREYLLQACEEMGRWMHHRSYWTQSWKGANASRRRSERRFRTVIEAVEGSDETETPDASQLAGGGAIIRFAFGDASHGIDVSIHADAMQFDEWELDAQLENLVSFLQQVSSHDTCGVGSVSLDTAETRERVLQFGRNVTIDGPRLLLAHQLFESHARSRPNAMALVYDREHLTYQALNAAADDITRKLRDLGVQVGDRVAICMDRGPHLIKAIFGALKAGACYVPVDPVQPAARIAHMFRDSAPTVILTLERWKRGLPDVSGHVLALDGVPKDVAHESSGNPPATDVVVDGNDLAYLIYTSGTSGEPKGVAVGHRQLNWVIGAVQQQYDLSPDDRMLQFASVSFDASVEEIFGALCSGSTLVLRTDEWIADESTFWNHCSRAGVSVMSLPTAYWHQIAGGTARIPQHVRLVVIGGEAVQSTLVERWFARSGYLPKLMNTYGPTEGTVNATAGHIATVEDSLRSIGRPMPGARIYVLDAHLQLLPLAVIGEIHVGGSGVARGYWRRDDLTAEKFVADPFSEDPQARMYRTGDLGRWRADGSIEFLGRNDHQVKIRGFRIELGEIEAQLRRHVDVKDAAVLAREEMPGEKRLIAYAVAVPGQSLSVELLRRHLQERLPQYMIPAAFVLLDALPLTSNGKLDRRALPDPQVGALVSRDYEPPEGELESTLAQIWQEVLQVERVGRQDNFFELGGHSLLIVRMVERLRQVGLSVEVRDVFAEATFQDLAALLKRTRQSTAENLPNLIPQGCDELRPEMLNLVEMTQAEIDVVVRKVPGGATNIQDVYPLSPLQEGIFFHYLVSEQADVYALPLLLSIESDGRLKQFLGALQTVIDRHDVLRTAIMWEDLRKPVQVVYRQALLPVEHLVLDPAEEPLLQLMKLMTPERLRMDVQYAPLLRLQLARQPGGSGWFVLLRQQHMVGDHVGLDVVVSEVRDLLSGRSVMLPEPPRYRDFVAKANEASRQKELEEFFRSKLQDVYEPTLPFGLSNAHGDGSHREEGARRVEPGLGQRLSRIAQARHVSNATLLHAAWALVVAHASGRDDVVFGTVLAGRMQGTEGADQVVGMLINTLPLRLNLSEVSASELLQLTHRELMELIQHDQGSLAAVQRFSGVPAGTPLFTALFNYRHIAGDQPQPVAGVQSADPFAGIHIIATNEWTNYPITLAVDDYGGELVLRSQVDDRVDPKRVVSYLHAALHSLADALENAPDTSALSLSILPSEERTEILELFNATRREYPDGEVLHGLFEAQVERAPDAIALEYTGEQLSYAELNARSNQLAHHLCEKGVGPDRLVGLCVERGPAMLIGILGILKAGGAYVPLDPSYPPERLRYMVSDSAAEIVLTQSHLLPQLPECAPGAFEAIALDTEWPQIARHPRSTPAVSGRDASHLAYVIYTSGSTGEPRGVAVEHAAAVNLWQGLEATFSRQTTNRIGLNASITFDASVQQLVQLLSGRTLVPVPQRCRQDSALLLKFLEEQQLGGIDCTPSQLKTWIEAGICRRAASLKTVLTGGEAIDAALWAALSDDSSREYYNVYGPTECTVDATLTRIGGTVPHIGRPMANRQIYILDEQQQPVPVGVTGEIYIGGVGVARGYWGKEELTAQRFMPDRFSEVPGARMYRTGDLGRWRPDGDIEYLGRNDQQVKIRGYRIEPGEIEAHLRRHGDVKDALVLAREDVPGEKRLVAYIVPDAQAAQPGEVHAPQTQKMVQEWESLYEITYGPSLQDDAPGFAGWISSYTAEPIPEAQMQEWLSETVKRIEALQPARVLEIGCGTGLVLQRLAPKCVSYMGTDFSGAVLERLHRWMAGREGYGSTELQRRPAADLSGWAPGAFDTVVLNSVVQYFPDVRYLTRVLQQAVNCVGRGGRIFLGDLRNLKLLEEFHGAVQLHRAEEGLSVGRLRSRIRRAVEQEKELLIAPEFFGHLMRWLPRIRSVDVRLKRGESDNELTHYRYDVVLNVGEAGGDSATDLPGAEVLEHIAEECSQRIEASLKRQPPVLRVCGMVNRRVERACALTRVLRGQDISGTAGELRARLAAADVKGADPESLYRLGERYGYRTSVRWSAQDGGRMDVEFVDERTAVSSAVTDAASSIQHVSQTMPSLCDDLAEQALEAVAADASRLGYTNDPLRAGLRGQLLEQLRQELKATLPEYMVPSAFVVLEDLPLTVNGKIDRRALPAPDMSALASAEYESPQGEIEAALADIWRDVLQVEGVGRHDDFFELGGHSIAAVKVALRAAANDLSVTVRQLFELRTLAAISASLPTKEARPDWIRTGPVQATYHYNCTDPSEAVFLLPPVYGGAESFFRLVGQLGNDVPVILLENIELYSARSFSMAELVEYYGGVIRSLAPNGPRAIGGWSRGGQVSVALAAWLERNAMPIQRLFLFDSNAPEAVPSARELHEKILLDPRVQALSKFERLLLDGVLDLRFGYRALLQPVQARVVFFRPILAETPVSAESGDRLAIAFRKLDSIIDDYAAPVETLAPTWLNGFEGILENVDIVPLQTTHNGMLSAEEPIRAIVSRMREELTRALPVR